MAAGEMTARVVLVLARRPYTAAFAAICEHAGDLILEEVCVLKIKLSGDGDTHDVFGAGAWDRRSLEDSVQSA